MVRQLGQLRPPAVAEVVKCVPVNTILGSELEREQSPGNGRMPPVGRLTHSKAHCFLWAIQPFQGLKRVENLSKKVRRGAKILYKGVTCMCALARTQLFNVLLKDAYLELEGLLSQETACKAKYRDLSSDRRRLVTKLGVLEHI